LSGVAAASTGTGNINGNVWSDQNCDGIWNAGEPGFANVEVQLYKNVNGEWVSDAYTITDSNGFYTFGNHASGGHKVKFIAPAGYYFSPMGEDSAASTNSENYGFTNPVCMSCANVVWNAGLCKKVCKEPLTQGYWKNHPEAWVNDDCIPGNPFILNIGNIEYGTVDQKPVIDILKQPVKGDARMILAHQLIAARLNVENGACPKTADFDELMDIIEEAETWLADQNSKVSPSTSPEAIAWAETLDKFNNGKY
jgi:hypothetical protein